MSKLCVLDTLNIVLNLGLSDDELAWFEAAELRLKLKTIKRYHIYDPMFYRTNVYVHSIRVALLVKELAHLLADELELDVKKAVLMALVHDDPEIITGDFQSVMKDKMPPTELHLLRLEEEQARHEIASRLPFRLGNHSYLALLEEQAAKESVEARIVDIADKLDGAGEGFHEVFAGNLRFVTPVVTEYGPVDTPPVSYQKFFKNLPMRHPVFGTLYNGPLSFLFFPKGDWTELALKGRRHGKYDLETPSGLPIYDFWKRALLKQDHERQLELLTIPRE